MKRNLLLAQSNVLNLFQLKSLQLLIVVFVVLGSSTQVQAQCIGPYARFESFASSTALTTGFLFNTSGIGSTLNVARSGLYYYVDGVLNASLITPVIDNPNTVSFYVKGNNTNPTYSVEYTTDNFVTPIDITSATAIAAGVTYTKPAVSVNWQLVTVTFGTPLNSSNFKLRIKDTYTRGAAASFYIDDISWTCYVSASSVSPAPGTVSTAYPENTVIVPSQTGTNIAAPLGVCAGGTVTVAPTAVYNFYDNGGASDTYNINQANQVTFTPSGAGYTAGDRVRIQFISYTGAATTD